MTIREINLSNHAQTAAFVNFAFELYKDNPCWPPPLKNGLIKTLVRSEGMNLSGGPHTAFVAERDGKLVARVLVGINEVKNAQRGLKEGYFALFECIDDIDIARAVMSAAEHWLTERRIYRITGPVSPTNGDDFRGIIISGFDDMPTVNTAFTLPYYPALMEELGYTKYMDFYTLDCAYDDEKLNAVRRVANIARRFVDVDIKPLDMKHIDSELQTLYDIFRVSAREQWEHLEMPSFEQFHSEFKALKPYIDPRMVLIARVAGNGVGFIASLPDYNQALAKLNGRSDPISLLKLLYYRRKITRLRVFMQFVVPEYQGRGVIVPLYLAMFEGARDAGYKDAEAATISELNVSSFKSVNHAGFAFKRTYRIYQKDALN